jgi:hypothetical protein
LENYKTEQHLSHKTLDFCIRRSKLNPRYEIQSYRLEIGGSYTEYKLKP